MKTTQKTTLNLPLEALTAIRIAVAEARGRGESASITRWLTEAIQDKLARDNGLVKPEKGG